ncbi:MAG: sulfatase-like hydrolase/transferase [Luteolibacter sp.]
MKQRILTICIACASGMVSASAAPARKPNIIVIVSDDQGYADAGFQGSRDIPTPHLDGMAREGVRCTRGYVTAPVCSPSRAGLLTGRYQERFGHHNNIVQEAANPIAHTPTDETLLPQVLAKAGYHTAMIGKWHLGQQDGCRPYERGFQEFFGIITGGHDYFVNNPDERAVGDSQYKARLERNGPVGEKVPGYLTDAFGDDAVRVIRESQANRPEQPFFLYLAFNAPHTPTQAPQPLVDAMPETLQGKERRTYAAQITSMDSAIGKVRAALKETGADKDTFIVFFSDNGGANHPYYDNTPLRDYKGTVYEGGIRVPFFATYPDHIPAGSVCDLPVTSLDVFATACALAGTTPETAHPLDSKDMLPVLEGKSKNAAHDTLYWDFGPNKAVSNGGLKLVVTKNSTPQLFDLTADIGEKNDLAAQRPDDVRRLTVLLEKWQTQNVRPLWGVGSGASALQNAPNTQNKPQSGREKLFQQRDTNKDGRISKEEFMSVQADQADGGRRFTKFDKNQDGVLSNEEFVNMGK